MGLMDESTTLKIAVDDLRKVKALLGAILSDLYDSAPGYAGEVEAVEEACDNAINVLSGKPAE